MLRQSSQHSMLPPSFTQRLFEIFPPHIARTIERTFIERPTSFRCNTVKTSLDTVLQELKREGFTVKRLNWSREGLILTNNSQSKLSKLQMYARGEIYLQSLASMVPVIFLDPKPGERVLDMTAAPGSKTSQIAALMKCQGALHACEFDEIRFQRLTHNMKLLLGLNEESPFLKLYRGDSNKVFLDQQFASGFDRILLDAPCSAESRIVLRERKTFGFWSESNILKRATEQAKLLRSAWRLLKNGGTLVYSTCTFAPEENEQQISEFLSTTPDARVDVVQDLSGVTMLPGLTRWRGKQLLPAVARSKRIVPSDEIEGFYIAKLKKS